MTDQIDPVLANALVDIGELKGLLKGHVEETKRDRIAAALERTDDRADRKAMAENLAKLAAEADKIEPLEKRMTDAETKIKVFDAIYTKITVAIAIIAGGLWMAFYALTNVWPAIKNSVSNLVK